MNTVLLNEQELQAKIEDFINRKNREHGIVSSTSVTRQKNQRTRFSVVFDTFKNSALVEA